MSRFQKLTLLLLSFILLFSVVAAAPNIENVTAAINHALKISLDGKEFIAKDANGKVIKPIAYKGSVYLPVRAVAEVAGLKVNYNAATSTVELISNQGEQKNTSSFNIPIDSIPFGSFPTADWKANDTLTKVSGLTFVNVKSTGTASNDADVKRVFNMAIEAIASGELSLDSSNAKWFVADSPDIDRIYELSKVCLAGKQMSQDFVITTKDVEIISLGYNPADYKLVKQNPTSKGDAWQAVVLKGTIVVNLLGETRTLSGYHILIKDSSASNALKYYAETAF